MANFLVVALLSFAIVLLVLNWMKYRIKKIGKIYGGSEEFFNEKVKGMYKNNWLDTIPGPKPFPLHFVGNIYQLQPIKKSIKKFFEWCEKYPICFKFIGFNRAFIILNSAPLAHALLKSTNMGHVNKSFMYETMKPYVVSGLIPANGGFWQHHRKILNRSMHYQSLRGYSTMINYHSRKLVAKLEKLFQDNQPHPINVLLNCSFVAIICEILTGSDAVIDEADVVDYHYNFQEWKATVIKRLMKPWLFIEFLWKLHPMSKEYFSKVNKLDGFSRKVLKVHEDYYNNNLEDENNNENPPYTSMLSDLRRANISEDQMVQEINSMLLAGHETVATAMHFFCFRLALKPEIQKACREEIDAVFEDPLLCCRNENGELELTYDALANLKYLERCIYEVLRIYSPVFIYLRTLQAPLPIQINGATVELPVGTNAVVVPASIHMNPKYYPDPYKFNPDRFLPEEIVKRPVGTFIPFSEGPRRCLGTKFAINELKIMGAFLLRHFEIETKDTLKDVPVIPYITLTAKRDFIFTMKRRNLSSES